MKSLVANAALGITFVTAVLVLIIAHELLASIAGSSGRFVMTRRWLSRAFTVLGVMLALLIIARFYYLRT